MTENIETVKKIVEPTPKGEVFNFTRDGIVGEAKNLEEAQKLLKKILKENKESANG